MKTAILCATSFLVIVLALTIPISASAETYTYTGTMFTQESSDWPPLSYVAGNFTMPSPLAANLNDTTIDPTSFVFTDWVDIIDNFNATLDQFEVSTDADGNITSWIFSVTENNSQDGEGYIYSSSTEGDYATFSYGGYTGQSSVTAPGTWVVPDPPPAAVTPEPSAILLLGTGMLGVAGIIRRKILEF